MTAIALAATGLAGCSSSGGQSGGGAGGGATTFTFLGMQEDPATPKTLQALADGVCAAENKALPLKIETTSQTNLDTKLQLLAGQNALPAAFESPGTPALALQLNKSGQLLDLTDAVNKVGAADDILPAATATIKNLYEDKLLGLPSSLNIEGFWYNKTLFSKYNLAVPTTWDELLADAATLQQNGVVPFATSADKNGWPTTRYISGYAYRLIGPSAMSDWKSGKTKLTDPPFVQSADAIAGLGAKGYFGKSVQSVDYATMVNTFLAGKAAIMYNGSWTLAAFADKNANKIGSDNIGFFAFPTVSGGQGSGDQLPSNVGQPISFGTKAYNDKVGAWIKCISHNWGVEALKTTGTVSGFKLNGPVTIDSVTQLTLDKIATNTTPILWLEAPFSGQQTTASISNVGSLVTGKMSGEQFMSLLQSTP